jgi:hypothetical protein
MVYRRHESDAFRRVLSPSSTAASSTATPSFVASDFIVLYAGDPKFPHLLVFADRSLGEPAPADKNDPEGQSHEGYANQDECYDQDFQHDVGKVSILL